MKKDGKIGFSAAIWKKRGNGSNSFSAQPAAVLISFVLLAAAVSMLTGWSRPEEVTREEAEARRLASEHELLQRTVYKPGPPDYKPGEVGGIWTSSLTSDPKTFNTLTARDGDSRSAIDPLFDYLADYDPHKREFLPRLADFEIEVDEANDSLTVIYTLRDDLYWTLPDRPLEEAVKVTSHDVVFWYDEIDGDRDLQLPAYPGQFIEMPDGSSRRIEIEYIDDRRFAFHFPRIISNPILSTNMQFGPRHIFEPVKEEQGIEGLLNLFSVDWDVKNIPSIGPYHLIEYTPGVRIVLQRNPHYWRRDDNGVSLPYIERAIYRIVPDKGTEFLLFKDGTRDSYSARPEDLEDLLRPPADERDYTVYNGGDTLGSTFFTFNQNPSGLDDLRYSWFIQTEFRQAMSSLLNRERIAEQVFRGLATPAHHFFATANPMFDEEIKLEYTYNPERAVELLASIGITRDDAGIMRDPEGNAIEFTLNVGAENNLGIDMCTIFADELKEVGITANVRPIDFQRLVEMLTSTYDWHAVHVALGANYWPEGGSNVWQSSGNFHLWHPLQESPATEWEARVDYLYNEGRFTLDPDEQKAIYDEYQRILLTELPVMYTVHQLAFTAVRDRWDNIFYDTLIGLDTNYLFLKDQ